MSDHEHSPWGAVLPSSIPLDNFGAPGYSIQERIDFSGHKHGCVDPHVNAEIIIDSSGNRIGRNFNDLANTQLPGFNGMQADVE